MKKSVFTLLLIICALSLIFAAQTRADIYRYVDKEGVVHLTNVPTDRKFKLWLKEEKRREVPSISRRAARGNTVSNYSGYDHLIARAADRHNVDSALIKAVIKTESGFDPAAVSRKGAMGLMQLMPGTANIYGVENSFDPWSNIDGGVRHLRYLLDQYRGNLSLALAAYNAGEASVQKYNNSIPPYEETQTYVKRVMQYLKKYSNDSGKIAQFGN